MKIIRAGCPKGNTPFSKELKKQSSLNKHKKVNAVAIAITLIMGFQRGTGDRLKDFPFGRSRTASLQGMEQSPIMTAWGKP